LGTSASLNNYIIFFSDCQRFFEGKTKKIVFFPDSPFFRRLKPAEAEKASAGFVEKAR